MVELKRFPTLILTTMAFFGCSDFVTLHSNQVPNDEIPQTEIDLPETDITNSQRENETPQCEDCESHEDSKQSTPVLGDLKKSDPVFGDSKQSNPILENSKQSNPVLVDASSNTNNLETRSSSTQTPFYQYQEFVGSYPMTRFDPNYRPKGMTRKKREILSVKSGAFLYTQCKNEKYFYIVKKTSSEGEFWSLAQETVPAGSSYLETALNAILKAGKGEFKFTEGSLNSESYDVFHHSGRRDYQCTFFLNIPESQDCLTPAHFQTSTYSWIRLNDFLSELDSTNWIESEKSRLKTFHAWTIDGKKVAIPFNSDSFKLLQQAHAKGILNQLD